MRSETEKTEKLRRQARIRMRRFRGSNITDDESVFDIPANCELRRYWRRWAAMRKDVDAAVRYFWSKRKRKYAYVDMRAVL